MNYKITKVADRINTSRSGGLCHEIVKVNSNKFGEYREYFTVRFSGDNRVIGLAVNTDIAEEQPAFGAYFGALSDTISFTFDIYKKLGYINRWKYRKEAKFSIAKVKKGWGGVITSNFLEISLNGERIFSIRELTEQYLALKLGGSGFHYTTRAGQKGDLKRIQNVEKYVTLDFDEVEKKAIYTIHTPFSKEEFKMEKLPLFEDGSIQEYILALEYIVAVAGNANTAETRYDEVKFII